MTSLHLEFLSWFLCDRRSTIGAEEGGGRRCEGMFGQRADGCVAEGSEEHRACVG